ncbi:hypothetical protein GCM10011289_08120 [Paludibacterium paludis]|uniref:Uncharacterized protein n=1 Tax=Paludibacterium paludis TaxID=1225769 RepID=A0A918NYW5_9NEIS|nr:hypothetical protein GCM10011289_08120 [Paludibacterium paludis]
MGDGAREDLEQIADAAYRRVVSRYESGDMTMKRQLISSYLSHRMSRAADLLCQELAGSDTLQPHEANRVNAFFLQRLHAHDIYRSWLIDGVVVMSAGANSVGQAVELAFSDLGALRPAGRAGEAAQAAYRLVLKRTEERVMDKVLSESKGVRLADVIAWIDNITSSYLKQRGDEHF